MTARTTIGTRVPRPDALDKVTGRAVYGMDTRRQGMLHTKVLWSDLPHASITSIDTSKAEKVPGVRAVITAADIPFNHIVGLLGPTDRPILAEGKVRFRGEPVAAVAAETEEAARAGVAAIEVSYEDLPILLDPEVAMLPDAPLIGGAPFDPAQSGYSGDAANVCGYTRVHHGDLKAAFDAADVVHTADYETTMVHQGYLEPHAVVAELDTSGRVVVSSSTQVPAGVRSAVAAALGLPLNRVRVVATHTGGGFGGKSGVGFEGIAATLAMKTGRPVRLALTREEELRSTFPRHAVRLHLEMGARDDGTITAISSRIVADTGGYAGEFGPTLPAGMAVLMAVPYKAEAVDVEAFAVLTNKPDCGAYRGPGSTQVAFALESHMDVLAEQLGMDALAFRLHNAVGDGDVLATGQVVENIGFVDTLRAAAERIGWGEGSLGPNEGIGIGTGLWFSGGFLGGGAFVEVNEDGSATLITAAADSGSGATLGGLRLIVAEELGISPDQVRVQWGDTDVGPWDGGAVGSRTTYSTGNAARLAAIDARNQILALAAGQFGVSPDDLEIVDGTVRMKTSPEMGAPLATMALGAHFLAGPVLGRGSFVAAGPTFDPERVDGLTVFAALLDPTPAVHAAKVRVDPEKGNVTVLRYVAAQDVGYAINPLGVEGQLQGGASEGIGEALSEEMVFDAEGRLLNPTLLDYKMPTPLDHSRIEAVIVEGHLGGGPYGAKGVGEIGIGPPPAAIANAVYRAVGARVTRLPLSPETVWKSMRSASGNG